MLNKNLDLLVKKNSSLTEMINSCKSNEIKIIETKDKKITTKLNGKILHSLYRPSEEAKKYIENYQLDNKKLILLLGFGLGYYVEHIIDKIENDCKLFIIIDNIELLKKSFEYIDYSEILLNENIYFYHTSEFNEYNHSIESLFKIGIAPETEIILHKIDYDEYELKYIKFIEILKNEMSNILMNTSTIFEFSKMWHRNSFINMPYFSSSIGINNLKDKYKEKPVIIVSAGPSLEKNIRYLHWAKNKAIIIAVGTSMKKLIKENIKPDFVMALDGGEPNWEHFKNINYSDIPLIFEPMVHPNILKYHTGKKIVFVSQNIVGAWGEHVFSEKGFLKMGGSVALTAYDFAVYIGGNPIILIGQDLAFTGGKTHVSGSTYEKDVRTENKEDIHQMYINDIYGDKILSDRKFLAFKIYFEKFISEDKKRIPNLKVIDATEGGAKIEYTDILSFKYTYFSYIHNETVDIQSDLDEIFQLFDEKTNLKKLDIAKKEMTIKLNSVKDEINKGINILKKAISTKNYSEIDKLNNIDEILNKNVEVSNLVRYISQHVISDVLKSIKNSNNEKDIFIKNLQLYEGIRDGINYNLDCISTMENVINR